MFASRALSTQTSPASILYSRWSVTLRPSQRECQLTLSAGNTLRGPSYRHHPALAHYCPSPLGRSQGLAAAPRVTLYGDLWAAGGITKQTNDEMMYLSSDLGISPQCMWVQNVGKNNASPATGFTFKFCR
jgi:hypothetical protein